MGYATVVDGVVTAISNSSSNGSIQFSGNVEVDWLYSNNTFTPPIPSAPISPVLTPTEEAKLAAAKAIMAGLQIASTGTPALNNIYSVTSDAQFNMSAMLSYVSVNGHFPGGGSTMPWVAKDGTVHVFPNTATFSSFATAVADYVSAVSLYADSGGVIGSLPSPIKAII